MAKALNTRAAAAQVAWQIIDQGQSLDACLNTVFEQQDFSPQDRGFLQELVYGVCRWYGELDWIAGQLLQSPIRKKDRVVHFVLLVGLYQQRHLETAAHAAVSETVAACQKLGKQWAKKLINGCLRTAQRSAYTLPLDIDALCHPTWIRDAITQAWPNRAAAILTANNARPPMCLRVNSMQSTRDEYLTQLTEQGIAATPDPYACDGIVLTQPTPVTNLPDFSIGACSVQDTAAQIAADILAPTPGMLVLDACAAPGGKTAHLLERTANKLHLDALDISASRCVQLQATLDRLQLTANVTAADASDPAQWQVPTSGYDRILIDAPCSGLGVIRRHPDIKHHRRPADIDQLTQIQARLLDALWLQLKPGGRLLYMTCSVLPAENHLQIDQFVRRQKGVMLPATTHPNALQLECGVQTLPGVHEMDGFYYCLLEKTSD